MIEIFHTLYIKNLIHSNFIYNNIKQNVFNKSFK